MAPCSRLVVAHSAASAPSASSSLEREGDPAGPRQVTGNAGGSRGRPARRRAPHEAAEPPSGSPRRSVRRSRRGRDRPRSAPSQPAARNDRATCATSTADTALGVAEQDRHLDGVEHGVAGAMDVERLERPRRVEHHRGDLAHPPRRVRPACPRVDEHDRWLGAAGLGPGVPGRGGRGAHGRGWSGRATELPAVRSAAAAPRHRLARRRPSGVSCAARASSAADAARPPRLAARVAARSSSAATSSSGDRAAAARCHALRSGSRCASQATANASWARLRSAGLAPWYTAERMSGWRNAICGPRSSRPAACAGSIAPSSKSSSRPARQIELASPVGSAAATSRSRWVGGGSPPTWRRKWRSSLRPTASGSGSGAAPASWSDDSSRPNSTSASGLPRASASEASADVVGQRHPGRPRPTASPTPRPRAGRARATGARRTGGDPRSSRASPPTCRRGRRRAAGRGTRARRRSPGPTTACRRR